MHSDQLDNLNQLKQFIADMAAINPQVARISPRFETFESTESFEPTETFESRDIYESIEAFEPQ